MSQDDEGLQSHFARTMLNTGIIQACLQIVYTMPRKSFDKFSIL